ncbi:MAG: porin [Gammaproteobacteria bacterium]
MRMNKTLSSGLLAAAALALAPQAASAWSPKLEVSDTAWVQMGYLHQFWYQSIDDGTADGSRSDDFFTRRNRFMLLGQAADNVHFFLNYDAASGNAAGVRQDPVLTDAFIDYRIAPEFNVMVGRMLVPFTIDNQSSAVSLTAIDYPTRMLANQPTTPSGAFWRDDGIMARGLFGGGMVHYRVGYFAGDRDNVRNPGGDGRITGMVTVNLATPQGGWFFNQNSLGALDVVTFGAGYDNMSRSNADDHEAWSLFFTVEKTLGAGHLSFNGTYIDWDGVVGGFGDGNSGSLQVAFLPTGSKWQPVLRWQQQDPDVGTKLDTVGLGLTYYISGHRAKIGAEYSIDDIIIDGSKKDAFRVQAQVFF